MSAIKTTLNDASVDGFIHGIEDAVKKQDSFQLLKLYKNVTGEEPKMWGASIIGFGEYHYTSERSAQEGDWPLVAFSPRKQNLTLYFMPGFDAYADLLGKLGKHKTSKGCLYVNKLADVDEDILKKLVERAYTDMKQTHGRC